MPKILNGTQNVLDILNAGGLFDQLNDYVGKEDLGRVETLSKLVKSNANLADRNGSEIKTINDTLKQKADNSKLHEVAFNGNYSDLNNRPVDIGEANSSFKQESSTVISEYDIALGKSNFSGCKGYYIKAIDIDNNKIYLSDNPSNEGLEIVSENYVNSKSFTIQGYEKDDYFSIIVTDKILNGSNNKNHYHLCSKIKSISDNVIEYVESIPFGNFNIDTNAVLKDQRTNLFFIPSKPMVGLVEISYGSYSEGGENKSGGRYSHAEGRGTIAAGDYSHVEGRSTSAGYAAHAEGESTKALGYSAHSEGQNVEAKGHRAHAEGLSTHALGDNSHTEGYLTYSYGLDGHAEGYQSIASGDYSHAEGYHSIALGSRSHAEGYYTEANNLYSHSEGDSTKANGEASHAEGYKSKTEAHYAHAEGDRTQAKGEASHAEGINTKALYQASHTEGEDTWSQGNRAHAEGYSTKANGGNSHAEGNNTIADGGNSHAEGQGTHAKAYASHAEGEQTKAYGDGSHAEGQATEANGKHAHAEGFASIANGENAHAEGNKTIASGKDSHTQGRYNIIDNNNTYAHIVGNGTNNDNRSNAHTLDWSGNAWFAGTVETTGVILTSPNGSKFKLKVDNDGNLSTEKILN